MPSRRLPGITCNLVATTPTPARDLKPESRNAEAQAVYSSSPEHSKAYLRSMLEAWREQLRVSTRSVARSEVVRLDPGLLWLRGQVLQLLEGLIKADASELVLVSVQPYDEDTGPEGGTDWFGKATASAAKADADAEGMYGLSASRPSMSGE
eukprot:gene8059-1293_t